MPLELGDGSGLEEGVEKTGVLSDTSSVSASELEDVLDGLFVTLLIDRGEVDGAMVEVGTTWFVEGAGATDLRTPELEECWCG